jgi:hypothetical protein
VPPRHTQHALRPPARYLVVIPSTDGAIARLFLEDHSPAGEFDAGTEELAALTRGAPATLGAAGAEWNQALGGHTAAERAAATVYVLAV